VQAVATGTPPQSEGDLDSQTIDVQTSGAGTITIFVNETGYTSPTGLRNWASTFTSNHLDTGLTVTEATCVINGTSVDVCSSPLHSANFSAVGTQGPFLDPFNTTSPYSMIEMYTVHATRAGTANLTIDLEAQSVPEPTSLALLGMAGSRAGAGPPKRQHAQRRFRRRATVRRHLFVDEQAVDIGRRCQ
jgi:hypothetical protein